MSPPAVTISIVTYHSAAVLPACLASLRQQTCRDFSVYVLDNGSTDGTLDLLDRHRTEIARIVPAGINLGFSAGHNRLLGMSGSPYLLFLNPDAVLEPDFLSCALRLMEENPRTGSLSPKIGRLEPASGGYIRTSRLDSTGMYWTRNGRHLDRGSEETDHGQYSRPALVFGVTGAAAFYRRECLDDIAFTGEVWDEDFFIYREDADLAWRAAWRGWQCLYHPALRAWHVRSVLPANRREIDPLLNRHAVKNRFLLRLKNMPGATWLRLLAPLTVRDMAVLGYALAREHSSLPAFNDVRKLWPRFRRKRHHVLGRTRISRREMEYWFFHAARPLPEKPPLG